MTARAKNPRAAGRGKLFARVKLVVTDVDGVLTDGGIVIDDRGIESKRFNVRDGSGIKELQKAGIPVAFLTGRQSNVVRYRAEELGVRVVMQGVEEKLPALREICNTLGLHERDVCYVGDDLLDIPALLHAGVAATVADGHPEVKKIADYVSTRNGGCGALREIAEQVLRDHNKWSGLISRLKTS